MNRSFLRTVLLAATSSLSLTGCVTITNTMTPERTVLASAPAAPTHHVGAAGATCGACTGAHTCGAMPRTAYGTDGGQYPSGGYYPQPVDPRYYPPYGYPGHYGYPQVIYVPVPSGESVSTTPRTGSTGSLGGSTRGGGSTAPAVGVPATRPGSAMGGGSAPGRGNGSDVRAGERTDAPAGDVGASPRPEYAGGTPSRTRGVPAETTIPTPELAPKAPATAQPAREDVRADVGRDDGARPELAPREPAKRPKDSHRAETGGTGRPELATPARGERATTPVAESGTPSPSGKPTAKPAATSADVRPVEGRTSATAARADGATKPGVTVDPSKKPKGSASETQPKNDDAVDTEPSKAGEPDEGETVAATPVSVTRGAAGE